MKKRHPLFVAGFPYGAIAIGYIILITFNSITQTDSEPPSGPYLLVLLFAVILLITGMIYSFYWLISTGRVLRKSTGLNIPTGLLLIVPLANYWWMWRYSQAAEVYTKEKQQAALAFVLIAALGVLGMAILQDAYNKLPEATDGFGQNIPTNTPVL